MIKLLFEKQKAYFGFTIHNKIIKGVMGKYILPYQPSDFEYVKRQVKFSRNQLPGWFVGLFEITPEEQKQYEEAKDDEALCEIILKDAKNEGARLISKEQTNGKETKQ